MERIETIRMKDFQVFHEVCRAKSIREVARRMQLTSGQVSKYIKSLEQRLNTRLFKRSPSGVLLTDAGADLLVVVEEILASGQKMEQILAGKKKEQSQRTFAIASTAFLSTHFVTPTICQIASELPEASFRFLDLSPDQMIPVGLRGGFDLAVHIGKISWPGTWTTEHIGKSQWRLCARLKHPLPAKPSLSQILKLAFVAPTYWTPEGLVSGNDQFPVSMTKRKTGFETATAEGAIPVVINTDQLAFLPALLIQPWIDQKLLRVINSPDLPEVEKDLYISVHSDTVPAKLFEKLVSQMKIVLA